MENEDYGERLREASVAEDRVPQDHGSVEIPGEQIDDIAPARIAFSRRIPRTSKQPWYEPYLREIRRTH